MSADLTTADAARTATIATRAVTKRPMIDESMRDRLLGFGAPVLLLALWELFARFHLIDTRFFPAPSSIFGTLVTLTRSGELPTNTMVSLTRLFFGIVIGGVPALILGLAMGLYRPIRATIDPMIAATYPIPKSAILPLILLIFGLGESSKIAMVAIGMFYPVVINTAVGVRQIDRIYLDVGKNFGANRWETFRTIAFPGALPFIMSGVKIGVGLGLILIAIAEMVGAQSGLGFMLWNAWQILQVNTMYVGLVMIALIGFLLSVILNEVERLLIPSKSER